MMLADLLAYGHRRSRREPEPARVALHCASVTLSLADGVARVETAETGEVDEIEVFGRIELAGGEPRTTGNARKKTKLFAIADIDLIARDQ